MIINFFRSEKKKKFLLLPSKVLLVARECQLKAGSKPLRITDIKRGKQFSVIFYISVVF